ncbi:glycosyltransferase family 4 protein [Kiloniella laminariae]|uniref:Glycosyltransferase family 4 protein n=1 Tax=Kiloniella laminariae TaxID=454162 RepID=A0ABT4LKB9_9PROT|nr:glycosyltransferase family 4 protein [Kiloniella laminariae]MCZ4281554.1 glycosyltransferase family 4 protein [Kiloniella laminariae]
MTDGSYINTLLSQAATPELPSLIKADGTAMTILQVVPAMDSGGVERGTLDMAKAIVEAGGKAIVASRGGQLVTRLNMAGVEHVELPVHSKNPWTMWRNTSRLLKVIRKHGVDLVHVRSRAPGRPAQRAARKAGIPFVTTVHAPYNIQNRFKRYYNSVMTRGDIVISISEFVSDYIRNNYEVDESKIRVVHRGMDTDSFSPHTVSAERVIQLSTKWRLPDGVPLIMLPGRLTRWKGQAILLQALTHLQDLDLCCALVGSDQGRTAYREELEKMIADLGLSERAFIMDNCDDMPSAYMLSDVVVSASTDPEGFGRVVSEGQAMGRPVVASNHGGAKEQLLPNETGFLFENGDAESCARAIRKALSLNAREREILSRKGQERVQQFFTKKLMCAKTLSIYSELINAKTSKAV